MVSVLAPTKTTVQTESTSEADAGYLPYTLTSIVCLPGHDIIDQVANHHAHSSKLPMSCGLVEMFAHRGVHPYEVHAAFERLGIPLPGDKSFYRTSDEGAILFLHRFGVVIRLSSITFSEHNQLLKTWGHPQEVIDHPCVLQPILGFSIGELRVEVLPGVRLSSNQSPWVQIKGTLAASLLNFFDTRICNVGYIGRATQDFPLGIPIVLDRNAVLRDQEVAGKPFPALVPMHTHIQLATYAQNEIKTRLETYTSAWVKEQHDLRAKPTAARALWNACAQLKEEEILNAGWMDERFLDIIWYHQHGTTSEAQKLSVLYEQRLSKYFEPPPTS
jgi:hypothetical protein